MSDSVRPRPQCLALDCAFELFRTLSAEETYAAVQSLAAFSQAEMSTLRKLYDTRSATTAGVDTTKDTTTNTTTTITKDTIMPAASTTTNTTKDTPTTTPTNATANPSPHTITRTNTGTTSTSVNVVAAAAAAAAAGNPSPPPSHESRSPKLPPPRRHDGDLFSWRTMDSSVSGSRLRPLASDEHDPVEGLLRQIDYERAPPSRPAAQNGRPPTSVTFLSRSLRLTGRSGHKLPDQHTLAAMLRPAVMCGYIFRGACAYIEMRTRGMAEAVRDRAHDYSFKVDWAHGFGRTGGNGSSGSGGGSRDFDFTAGTWCVNPAHMRPEQVHLVTTAPLGGSGGRGVHDWGSVLEEPGYDTIRNRDGPLGEVRKRRSEQHEDGGSLMTRRRLVKSEERSPGAEIAGLLSM